MEGSFRISIIDERIITLLLQSDQSFFFYLDPAPWPLNPFHRCRVEILSQPSMPGDRDGY